MEAKPKMPEPVNPAHDDSGQVEVPFQDGSFTIELLTSDQSSSTNPVSQIDALSNLFNLMNFCRPNLISVFRVPQGETRDPDKSILVCQHRGMMIRRKGFIS